MSKDASKQTPAPASTRPEIEAFLERVRGLGPAATAGKRGRRGKPATSGAVSPAMMLGWVREKGVVLRGGGLDESPHVYRRLPKVLEAQGRTIEVLHTLRPLVVVMAGEDEFDPYRD